MADIVAAKFLAKILDMHERSIRRYAKAGIIVRVGYGKYALAESVQNYVGVLRAAARRQAMSFDNLLLDALKGVQRQHL
jgi:hypothetical protein